ncbi:hypothetical protein [Microbacterium sp. bgisy203]|uniref:hypothetical protein n=1 Tax=Microbacterium sp. bgisy203 TaxID=3413799 RepID=UPI003D7406E2
MTTRTRTGAAVLAIAAVLALAGCASGAPTESYPGGPAGGHGEETGGTELTGEPEAFYLENAGAIAVVLWGSSSCPTVGERMIVEERAGAGNAVRVETREVPEQTPCTLDLVPHTTVFATPGSVKTTEPLTIRIDDTELTLVDEVHE